MYAVYLANTEWQTDLLSGASLHAVHWKAVPDSSNICWADITDGGFADCEGARGNLILRKEGENSQLALAEARIYSHPNAMKSATLASESTPASDTWTAANLILQAPRTTSTERTPNGDNPELVSCASHSTFPVHYTFNLGGKVKVENILAVGNAAQPLNSQNFKLFVGDSPTYSLNMECPDGPFIGPTHEDY